MEDRRSTRLPIVLPVTLSGIDNNGQAFKENTWTMGINKHGAKLSTAYRLAVGDQVMVGNTVLGHYAQARVTRVIEKGRAFEIGVELTEPQDVWGPKFPPADWTENNRGGARDVSGEKIAESSRPDGGAKEGRTGGRDPADSQPESNPAGTSNPPEDKSAGANGPPPGSLTDFLRTSRAELKTLLARTREIQQLSCQAVQSAFEGLHGKLHQELEAASREFVSDTHRRLQDEASAALEGFSREARGRLATLFDEALTKSQAAHSEMQSQLKQGTEEAQKRLAELSTSAFERLRQNGEALFETLRLELQNAVEEFKKKEVDDISDRLRNTAADLAEELRRRADVGFEILKEQLSMSGKARVEETEKQLAAIGQEICTSVHQQAGAETSALKGAANQVRASLEACLKTSVEAFQKQLGELSEATVERHRQTSETLLQDLHNRLDQAARALMQIGAGATASDRK